MTLASGAFADYLREDRQPKQPRLSFRSLSGGAGRIEEAAQVGVGNCGSALSGETAGTSEIGVHLFFVELILDVSASSCALGRSAALKELRRVLTRLARRAFGPLRWIATDLWLQFHNVLENIGLPPQFVGDHRRLCRDG